LPKARIVQQTQTPKAFLPDYSRNAKGFILSSGLFSVAMSFISATTVLPSFVAMLTNSEVLIGLSSSLMSGGWLLPQLFIASAVARLPHKRPLMVRAAWISRPLLLVLALCPGST